MAQEDVFKKLVSHCKEYGFVFPSSDIYDGLGAVYDYGQMGVVLKITSRNTGGTAWCCCTRTLSVSTLHLYAPYYLEGFRTRRRIQ